MIALFAVLVAAGAAEPGLKLLREGRAAEAAESFSAALRKDPRNASLANDLGLANARAGARQEAERNFRVAIQLRPRRWLAYGNLADLLSSADDRWERADETLALLERGVALASGEGKASLSLRVAAFEISVGRTAQARKRLAALEDEKPGAENPAPDPASCSTGSPTRSGRARWRTGPSRSVSAAQRDGLANAQRKLLARRSARRARGRRDPVGRAARLARGAVAEGPRAGRDRPASTRKRASCASSPSSRRPTPLPGAPWARSSRSTAASWR